MSEAISQIKCKTNSNPIFSYDLLYSIFEFLQDDLPSLFRCSLVSWEANDAALKLLYREVELHISYLTFVRNLSGHPFKADRRLLNACLPRNRHHVRVFSVNTYFISRYAQEERQKIVDLISSCIRAFSNLRSMVFLLSEYNRLNDETFVVPFQELVRSQSVRQLEINNALLSSKEEDILLPWIRKLQTLIIHAPSSSTMHRLLNPVDQRLEGIFKDMTELHLLRACNSISPDILMSIALHLTNIKCLTLENLPPASNAVLFDILGQMSGLHSLCLHHDHDFEYPGKRTALPCLRSFTVSHSIVQTRADANTLCKWIVRVIASSPLEHLRLVGHHDHWNLHSNVSHDILIEHIMKKHTEHLKSLQMRNTFVGKATLRALCMKLPQLEEIQFSTSRSGISTLMQCSKGMTRLHTVGLIIQNAKRSERDMTVEEATAMFKDLPALRRLTVNHKEWKISWDTDAFIEMELVL